MSSVPLTDTVPEIPAISDKADRIVLDPGWQYRQAKTLEEASDWLDLLENLRVQDASIERKGQSYFVIRWRGDPRFQSLIG